MDENILTVSELTELIKSELEEKFPGVWVTGEISNYLHHSSGHRYFTLKDSKAQLKCVIWKFTGQHLPFEPENGMKVKIFGDITVYPKGGIYQIRVTRLMSLGIGDLEEQFQKLKEKLFEEGLFDEEHKKEIPQFPQTIGIVTSPTGAAIRDLINVLRRRAPYVKIIIAPVHVQGDEAVPEIVSALDDFNRFGEVDVIITGRGGGSLEDLWAFNEEEVARAIFRSKIPVISAVGHQIDYTISDFVADLRAPTPSAAAELAVTDYADLKMYLDKAKLKLSRGAMTFINLAREKLNGLKRSAMFRRPLELVNTRQQIVDDLRGTINKLGDNYMINRKHELESLEGRLKALSPKAVLKRGFSIVRSKKDNLIVRDSTSLKIKDDLEITLHRGGATAEVTSVEKESS